jgi:hypothetical protein
MNAGQLAFEAWLALQRPGSNTTYDGWFYTDPDVNLLWLAFIAGSSWHSMGHYPEGKTK